MPSPYVTMAEWSNATDLRSVSPGSAGSNPAGDNFILHDVTVACHTFKRGREGASPSGVPSLVSSVGRASDF